MSWKSIAGAACLATLASVLAGCSKDADPTQIATTRASSDASSETERQPARAAQGASAALPASTPLAERLDCLREAGGVLVVAHRGGPNRNHPENAIETFERAFRAGALGMEIDIAQSRDGVLFLMHDDDLERTTTGEGLVGETDWTDIESLNLETYSRETSFHPPTLDAALDWAVSNRALVELDKKRSTSLDAILDAVEAHKAANNVLFITYTDDQAVEAHQRSADIVITASVDSLAHLDRLLARGVDPERLVAWAGTEHPDPDLWRDLRARGVEVAFGTLGPYGSRFDDVYWADDDGTEYRDLVDEGVSLIATDLSDKVSRVLEEDQDKARTCGF